MVMGELAGEEKYLVITVASKRNNHGYDHNHGYAGWLKF
jgi:hypothetical protein